MRSYGSGGRVFDDRHAIRGDYHEQVRGEELEDVVVGGGADDAGAARGEPAQGAGERRRGRAVEDGGELVDEHCGRGRGVKVSRCRGDGGHGPGEGEAPALAVGEARRVSEEERGLGESGAGEGAYSLCRVGGDGVEHRGRVDGLARIDGDHRVAAPEQAGAERAHDGTLAAAAGPGDEGDLAGSEAAVDLRGGAPAVGRARRIDVVEPEPGAGEADGARGAAFHRSALGAGANLGAGATFRAASNSASTAWRWRRT